MAGKINRWYAAILNTLEGDVTMSPEQIWSAMAASGFAHKSVNPRGTLTARITELREMQKVERVGYAAYRRLA